MVTEHLIQARQCLRVCSGKKGNQNVVPTLGDLAGQVRQKHTKSMTAPGSKIKCSNGKKREHTAMIPFPRKASGVQYWRSEFFLLRSLLGQQQSPQGVCAMQLEGHLEGEQSCLCKHEGECSSLQRCPEIHSVTKNCNSKSMTPSKSSQTMPKIIEKEW